MRIPCWRHRWDNHRRCIDQVTAVQQLRKFYEMNLRIKLDRLGQVSVQDCFLLKPINRAMGLKQSYPFVGVRFRVSDRRWGQCPRERANARSTVKSQLKVIMKTCQRHVPVKESLKVRTGCLRTDKEFRNVLGHCRQYGFPNPLDSWRRPQITFDEFFRVERLCHLDQD